MMPALDAGPATLRAMLVALQKKQVRLEERVTEMTAQRVDLEEQIAEVRRVMVEKGVRQ